MTSPARDPPRGDHERRRHRRRRGGAAGSLSAWAARAALVLLPACAGATAAPSMAPCVDSATYADPVYGDGCAAWAGADCSGRAFSAELVANCTAACGGCAPSAAPTAPRGNDGDDGDDDLNSENAVMVGGGVLVVVLCVFCCFKLLPHFEYERAKHNNKLYPGTVMVVKPASPGRVAPLMFGPESYDIPTPNQQRKASERATKHLSVEHKNRVTAMIEHDRKRAEEQAKDLELLDVVPSPKAPGERRSVAVATPLSHGGAGRRGTAGRGRMMPT